MTEGSDSTEISPRVPVADANAVSRVVEQVTHWASWFNVLSIDNQTSTVDVDIRIERLEGGGTRSPFDNVDDIDADFRVGEEFQITVENKTDKKLYLSMLDLSTDVSIDLVYPDAPGAEEILAPRGTWTKQLETTLPDGRDEIKDILKVFATSAAVNFSFLTRGAVRGDVPADSNDPLTQLLAQAARGVSRGIKGVDTESWGTTMAVIRVRR